MITPKPQARSRIAAALSAFKSKITKSRTTSRSQSSSSTPAPTSRRSDKVAIIHERRYIQGLGYVFTDAVPCRSRQAVTEAKYGNSETKNEVVNASVITNIAGFVYGRDCANEIDLDVSAGTIRSGMVVASRLPTITTAHAAMGVVPMSGVVDFWEGQEGVMGTICAASCPIA